MRTAIEWRSVSRANYKLFCKKHPNIKLHIDDWRKIIYSYNEMYKEYLLETGEKEKLPYGLGNFSIVKKKRQKVVSHNGVEHINLPIDWKKTKEKGKIIYNFNFHTGGFYFGWKWFKDTARFKHSDLWYFEPCRVTSRQIKEYLFKDEKYQHLYKEWNSIRFRS